MPTDHDDAQSADSKRLAPVQLAARHPWLLVVLSWSLSIAALVAVWTGMVSGQLPIRVSYAGIFLLTAVSAAAVVVTGPAEVGTLLAARRLDPLPLALVAGLGTAIGELTIYAIGASSTRVLPCAWQARPTTFYRSHLYQQVRQRSFVALVVLAAVPNPFFSPVSLASGSSRLPLWRYFVPVFLGKCLRFLVISYTGSHI